jgi:peptidoglycan/LPS O-acetylase OafA/YrhL
MSRRNNFDFLRLFAALLVIYGHAYPLLGATDPSFAVNSVQTIGVKIFFSISGYLVALSWYHDPNAWRFFLRRVTRIFPALVVVILITGLVAGPFLTEIKLSDYFLNARLRQYMLNIFLDISYDLPGVFRTNIYPIAVNGSLWTLPAEISMYVAFPIIASIGTLIYRPRLFVLITTIVFCILSFYLQATVPNGRLVLYNSDVFSFLLVCPYFLVGACFAVYDTKRFLNIYVSLMLIFILEMFQTSALVKEIMLLLILPYVSIAFGVGTSVLSAISRIGDLSYGIYLYGFPVQQTVVHFIGSRGGPWANFWISSLVAGLLAFGSWHLIEKNALKLKPRARVAPAGVTPLENIPVGAT